MRAWKVDVGPRHVGFFEDEKDAARAHDEAAIAMPGYEVTALNFPMGINTGTL